MQSEDDKNLYQVDFQTVSMIKDIRHNVHNIVKEHLEQKVRIEAIDGQIFEGVIVDFDDQNVYVEVDDPDYDPAADMIDDDQVEDAAGLGGYPEWYPYMDVGMMFPGNPYQGFGGFGSSATPYGAMGPFGGMSPYGQMGPFGGMGPYGQMGPFGGMGPYGPMGPFGSSANPYGQVSPFGSSSYPGYPYGQENVPFGQVSPYHAENAPFGQVSPYHAENVPFGQVSPFHADKSQVSPYTDQNYPYHPYSQVSPFGGPNPYLSPYGPFPPPIPCFPVVPPPPPPPPRAAVVVPPPRRRRRKCGRGRKIIPLALFTLLTIALL